MPFDDALNDLEVKGRKKARERRLRKARKRKRERKARQRKRARKARKGRERQGRSKGLCLASSEDKEEIGSCRVPAEPTVQVF